MDDHLVCIREQLRQESLEFLQWEKQLENRLPRIRAGCEKIVKAALESGVGSTAGFLSMESAQRLFRVILAMLYTLEVRQGLGVELVLSELESQAETFFAQLVSHAPSMLGGFGPTMTPQQMVADILFTRYPETISSRDFMDVFDCESNYLAVLESAAVACGLRQR